jgi:hypothetical protein
MRETEQIEIQLSKSKLTLLFLGSIMFVGLGVWYVISPPKVNISIFSNPTVVFIVGLASILFFGLAGFFIFKKLFDKSPGLIISDEGVFDNSSGASAGFVPWTDIVEIKETKTFNQSFINLVVRNPQDYIDRQNSAFKRKLTKINYNSYGTVIGISANGLKIKYKELKDLLDERFADFHRKSA